MISGIFLYIIFTCIDYRHLCLWGYFIYWLVLAILIFTLLKGSIGMGAQRWINVFLFKFQPSETTKLFLPAFIIHHLHARHLDNYRTNIFDSLFLLGIILLSTILILKQPDLGTSVLILISGFFLLTIVGLEKKVFLTISCLCFLLLPLCWQTLKPYQKQRIAVFLGQGDVTKERYQLEQATIAIGSGGVYGKGLLRGTQNRLMFLPEGRTDFIFAVVCEEWGFLGAVFIIILYLLLFLRLLYIAWSITNYYPQLLAFGLTIPLALSSTVNIAMVTGLLPVVGIPLPLLSYGISNLWITYASLGWINSIQIKRHAL